MATELNATIEQGHTLNSSITNGNTLSSTIQQNTLNFSINPGGQGAKGEKGDTGDTLDHLLFNHEIYFDGQNQFSAKRVIDYVVPVNGYLIGLGVVMRESRTAGTILFKPAKNGNAITQTDLDLYINASYTLDNFIEHDTSDANFQFSQGDRLGLVVTSTSFSPLDNIAAIYVYYKRS